MKALLLASASLLALSCPALAGTPVCGKADDTAAVQAEINTGRVDLPYAMCKVCSLDATNRSGLVMIGQGLLRSELVPICSGVNVLDLTGSGMVTLRDFHLNGMRNTSIVPKVGILSAQPSIGFTSDALLIERVRVDGHFGLATWYNLQVQSAMVAWSQFYNYRPSAIVIIFTGNNFFGVGSAFTAINNANNGVPSDWTFVQNEIHNLGGGVGLWNGGTDSLRYYGGNISSNGGYPVDMNAVVVNGVAHAPSFTMFDGTTFYADIPPSPACAIHSGALYGVITRGNQTGGFPLTC